TIIFILPPSYPVTSPTSQHRPFLTTAATNQIQTKEIKQRKSIKDKFE
ncbi:hypothetical protein Leryth_024100, partial [Lithospermum erythrorhizon]